MEIMPLAPCDAGTEGVYIIANDSTSGTVLINDYFENETKKSDGTSYGESSYYFQTKDLKYSLCLYREGNGTLDDPSNSGQKITWTNTEGVVKITYENGQSDSFNWYDNDMLCLTSCIIPCKYVDEITVATSVVYSSNTGVYYKYQENYLTEALRILPTEMKKTIILCGYDKAPSDEWKFSREIRNAIAGKGKTQKNVHLVMDMQYKNYYPYKLSFNNGSKTNCIVSFRIDATDVTLNGGETYEINKNCFSQWESLKEVYISENYNVIGENAFSGCNALEKVEFGNPTGWIHYADEGKPDDEKNSAGIREDAEFNASLLKDGNVKFLHE